MNKQINKILFIGLGGAGQRHLRIFRQFYKDADFIAWRKIKKTPLLNSDFTVSKETNFEKKFNLTFIENLDDAFKETPDLVVLSCPTAVNFDLIKRAFLLNLNVFVEKPAVSSLKEAQFIKNNLKNRNFFVSFQRRYHPITKKLFKLIKTKPFGKVLSSKVIVSSHVPSWHPYENFLDLYACKKNLGGGVLRTECHELDIMLKLFGLPNTLESDLKNSGPYELDVEDQANLTLKYSNFNIQINLNFMSKLQERTILIKFEDVILFCDFLKQTMEYTYSNGNKIIDEFNLTNDQMFEKQLSFFVNQFNSRKENFGDDLEKLFTVIEIAEKNG